MTKLGVRIEDYPNIIFYYLNHKIEKDNYFRLFNEECPSKIKNKYEDSYKEEIADLKQKIKLFTDIRDVGGVTALKKKYDELSKDDKNLESHTIQTIIDNFNQASDSTIDINWVKQNYKNDKKFITASNDLKYQTFKYKLKKIYNYTEEELQKFVPADSDPYFIKHLKNFADEFNRLN